MSNPFVDLLKGPSCHSFFLGDDATSATPFLTQSPFLPSGLLPIHLFVHLWKSNPPKSGKRRPNIPFSDYFTLSDKTPLCFPFSCPSPRRLLLEILNSGLLYHSKKDSVVLKIPSFFPFFPPFPSFSFFWRPPLFRDYPSSGGRPAPLDLQLFPPLFVWWAPGGQKAPKDPPSGRFFSLK